MDGPDQTDDLARKATSVLSAAETRLNLLETIHWSLPGLALASQAFLFSITLDPATSDLGRLFAATVGLSAALATIHFTLKNLYWFDLHEAVVDAERERLQLPTTHRRDLAINPDYARRFFGKRWAQPNWWRKHLIARWSAVSVWLVVFALFAAIDAAIFVLAVLGLAGVDNPLAR